MHNKHPGLEAQREKIRHSAAHVLAEAVLERFPRAKPTLGPPTEHGFYYDFDVPEPFTQEDLTQLEIRMIESINANHSFVERTVTRDEGKEIVGDNHYKLEIIGSIPDDESITFTKHALFEDLCRGNHVATTGQIGAFKLLNSAGAYWRGDEQNAMLQRIYGTAWESQDALDDYLERRAEAERRDHRRVGREMNLFFFDPIAPASPFFLPKGTIIFNLLVDYMRRLYPRYGYQEVITPQIFSTDLWKRSGHYDNYIENMFLINADEREHGVKPMNCPAAAMVFSASLHSYRELPIRLADFGRLHRYERSGTLHGLTRVRSMTQDDAHIFCMPDQIRPEVHNVIKMLQESYSAFGFERASYVLSLRPDKRIGSDEIWDLAEDSLKTVLTEADLQFETAPGEGAFYGPKIDVFVPDALGREWQLGTVQLDFAQPERFDLEYVAESGSRQRPVMIHRVILGTLERFIGVLIEHTAGALPLWLAPTQVMVIPITDRHVPYSSTVRSRIESAGFRVEVDQLNERMNAKIRRAQLQKIPYMLIVGDREEESGCVSVRSRNSGDLGAIVIDDLIRQMQEEIDQSLPQLAEPMLYTP